MLGYIRSECNRRGWCPDMHCDINSAVPFYSGLPNGHPPKKQKKSKKDEQLPSYESMVDGSGMTGVSGAAAAAQQQSSSGFDSNSAGAQEAALHLVQSLLQVTASCSLPTFVHLQPLLSSLSKECLQMSTQSLYQLLSPLLDTLTQRLCRYSALC